MLCLRFFSENSTNVTDQTQYSPDVFSVDINLHGNLKLLLRGRFYEWIEAINNTEGLKNHNLINLLEMHGELRKHWHNCIAFNEAYLNDENTSFDGQIN